MKDVALITGAASGIGEALAEEHAKRGRDLVLVDVDEGSLERVKNNLGKKYLVSILSIHSDLTAPLASEKIFKELEERGIVVDYLINDAGFGGCGFFHERDWEQVRTMLELNIVALTELTRLFLPGMVRRKQGKILNLSSTAALTPGGPFHAVYHASKAYVLSFSLGIASELEGTGVSVTALCPGVVKTNFLKKADMVDRRIMNIAFASAEKVAHDGYIAMERGALMKITGLSFLYRIEMFFAPLIPTGYALKQVKNLYRKRT